MYRVLVQGRVGGMGPLWLSRIGWCSMLLFFCLLLEGGPAEPRADDGLLRFLPRLQDLAGWRLDGPPQSVEGEGLYSLIDGGAEVFLKAGFERAVSQTYRSQAGQFVVLEVYEMKGPSSAEKIFAHKAEGGGMPEEMGDAATRGDYYVVFRQGGFVVTVTGSDSKADTLEAVVAIARAVESRIREASR
ncbi:MAG: DUF6599 family protein [Thermodesulfobacteriota bacterium]